MMQGQQKQVDSQFVGREQEITLLERWLIDENAPGLFFIHDKTSEPEKKGGIGKTYLLKEFARRARVVRPDLVIVNVDFFNVTDRDRIVVAERVVRSLQEAFPNWSPGAFKKALSEYFGGSYVGGTPPEKDVDIRIRDALSDALALDLQELEKTLESTDTFLLLFFDTFEVIEDNPTIAVLGSSKNFPDTYGSRRIGVVIAGRNALDWSKPNWQGREQEVRSIALTPFGLSEMIAYIDAESLYDLAFQTGDLQTLYELTAGRPILIGLATDVLNHRVMSLQDLLAVPHTKFEERLVAEVNHLEDPLNWVLLFMAHVYHRFNMETLDWIAHESNLKYTENVDYQQLIESLPGLSFVRQSGSGDDFVLHDEMRRLVNKHCWEVQDTDRGIRREISRCMVDYCDRQMGPRLSEEERQLYIIMKMYHLLFLDLNKGMAFFADSIRNATNRWRSAFARSLLQEVQAFSSEFSAEQHYDLIFASTWLLRSEENPQEALREHERLKREASAEWFAEQEIEILIEKGRCHSHLRQLYEAGECFNQALILARARGDQTRSAFLLGQLGINHRLRGELDTARKFYEECIVIQKAANQEVAYADTLNNLSNILRLKGHTEEALRICKISLRMRRRLVQERKTGERAVALSLNTLGLIYIDSDNFGPAEQVLLEAFELFSRINDKRSMAMGYNRLGRVQLAKGELEQAQDLFKKAQEVSEDVNPEALIVSLNRQARILSRRDQWQEAVPLFRRAIQVADQIHDYYQKVESLIYFVPVLERLGQLEEAQRLWEQAQKLATQENYLLLQARAEIARGSVRYDAGDYAVAFEYYGRACQYAVQYNAIEYNEALRNLSDKLLDVPTDAVPGILTNLLAFWTALGFDSEHPELIDACTQMQQFMSL